MGTFIAFGKAIAKNFIFNISTKKAEDDTLLKKTLTLVLVIIIITSSCVFAFICLSPISILASFFLGLDLDTVVQIKTEYGFMQKQDVAYLKNKGIERSSYDSDGNLMIYETDEFSDVYIENNTTCVYYNQADSRWADHPYAGSTSMWAACGPTAMSMVVSTLTGKDINPPSMMDIATKNGYACNGSGSYHSIVPGISKQFRLNCKGIGYDKSKLKTALEEGKLVVALMGKGHFTNGGHFIVLRGITSDGKVLVNDPSSNRRTGQSWDIDIFPNESIKWAGSEGPFWVISK